MSKNDNKECQRVKMASPHRHKVDLKETNFRLNVDMELTKVKKNKQTKKKKHANKKESPHCQI